MASKRKWNEKYSALTQIPQVNEYVKRFATLAPKGRTLDIACGVGQNSLYLADLGFRVDAIDFCEVALAKIPKHPNITPILTNVVEFSFPRQTYALILCTNFLERSIFSYIKASLKEEGVLIYSTFNYKKQNFNEAYLLQRNELLEAFGDLEVLYYEALDERSTIVVKKDRGQSNSKRIPDAFQTSSKKG